MILKKILLKIIYIEDKNIQESLMEDALIEFKKGNRFIRSKKSKSISPTRELLNSKEAKYIRSIYESDDKSLPNEINEEINEKYCMKDN